MKLNPSATAPLKEGVQKPPAFCVEIEKSDFARIRISLSSYKGYVFVDFWTFVKNDSGEFIPTKKGITISPEQLGKFIAGLQRIQREWGEFV